jgi:hypothetical protein
VPHMTLGPIVVDRHKRHKDCTQRRAHMWKVPGQEREFGLERRAKGRRQWGQELRRHMHFEVHTS